MISVYLLLDYAFYISPTCLKAEFTSQWKFSGDKHN